jgi:hypothetical protein
MIQPTDFVKQHAPWSLSKAGVAKQCPKRFELQYLRPWEERKDKGVANSDALVGRAVHEMLHLVLTGRNFQNSLPGVIAKHSLCTNEIDKIHALEPNILKFKRNYEYYCKTNPVGKTFFETPVAVGYTYNLVSYRDTKSLIRGILDIGALYTDAPNALILDHKTGKVTNINTHMLQFKTYAYLWKVLYPHIKYVVPFIHWLQTGTIEKGTPINVQNLDVQQDELISYLNSATKYTANNPGVIKISPLCGWCDYKLECPGFSNEENHGKDKTGSEKGIDVGTQA